MVESLVLVDCHNRPVGEADKQTVHRDGLLHRAFSVFLIDSRGRLVLQRRHRSKYHSGGLWANACCGHPRPGERITHAARRRLQEELGAATRLHFGFISRYQTTFPNGLKENEFVYVYFGRIARAAIQPNPLEVESLCVVPVSRLRRDLKAKPESYAFWFRHYFQRHGRRIASCLKNLRVGASERAV